MIQSDYIIEAHDCYHKGTTEKIKKNFIKTHKIEIVIDYPRNPEIAKPYSEEITIMKLLVDEERSNLTSWIRLTKLK